MTTPVVTLQTYLPPAPPFPAGYSFGFGAQTWDWNRNVGYTAIGGSALAGIQVVDLTTLSVTQLVTIDSMYVGTAFTMPGTPPNEDIYSIVCCNEGTNLYLTLRASLFAANIITRINPDTWKVTGVVTVAGEIGGTLACVNKLSISGTPYGDIVAFQPTYPYNLGMRLYDGVTMSFLWEGPTPRFPSSFAPVIAGIRGDNCQFWFVNPDWIGATTEIDVWRITVSSPGSIAAHLLTTLIGSTLIVGATTIWVQRAEYDVTHNALLLWVAATEEGAALLVSVAADGSLNWTYQLTGNAVGAYFNKGESLLTGNTLGIMTSINQFTLLNTSNGTLIETDTLPSSPFISPSFFEAWNSATRTDFTYALAVAGASIKSPAPELKLVSLYPIHPTASEYGLMSDVGGDFPSSFSQISVSMWCCKSVNYQLPNGLDGTPNLQMSLSPSAISITATDASANTLFAGSWTNPGTVSDEYQVLFSLDTSAQTYTLYVTNQVWTAHDVAFPNVGSINNGVI